MHQKTTGSRLFISIALCILAAVFGAYAAYSAAGTVDISDADSVGKGLQAASLIPTALAILLAFIYKNVAVSLAAGLLSGSMMIVILNQKPLLYTVPEAIQTIVETVSDPDNMTVLILCMAIGGMVEVIRYSGGFESLAQKMTRSIDTPRKANLVAESLGIIVFFDDYANSLIVGPVMKNITDRLKISREKLAFIVDSTAAPVTGIAIISSWVAVEVSVIEQGLLNAGMNVSGYTMFISCIPYCFYCILCLIFIFESSLTGREFGPMLQAEMRARSGETLRSDSDTARNEQDGIAKMHRSGAQAGIRTAAVPLAALFAYALVLFYITGRANAIAEGLLAADAAFSIHTVSIAFGQADTIAIVLQATLLASVIAAGMGIYEHAFTLKEAIHAFVHGCMQLLPTCLILSLAWSLSSSASSLGTVEYAVGMITSNVVWWLVPVFIFLACCLVSFAVGSFGCMFIALPMAIPIAVSLMQMNEMIHTSFLPLCIGCALSGCIFGDHCSPITDCTVLSSQGSGCDNFDHVKTQEPYAMTIAAVSAFAGILPATFGFSAWICILCGTAVLYVILLVFGRVPELELAKGKIKASVFSRVKGIFAFAGKTK